MASYNKVILLGNLTRDPQLSFTPSQTAVVDFGLATNRRWRGQDGTQRDETCFVDCRMFGKRAEVISKYLKKGQPIFIEGRLNYSTWEAQDGSKRSRLRVHVENFEFVGGGGSGSGSSGPSEYGGSNNASNNTNFPEAPEYDMSAPDDDIPF